MTVKTPEGEEQWFEDEREAAAVQEMNKEQTGGQEHIMTWHDTEHIVENAVAPEIDETMREGEGSLQTDQMDQHQGGPKKPCF